MTISGFIAVLVGVGLVLWAVFADESVSMKELIIRYSCGLILIVGGIIAIKI